MGQPEIVSSVECVNVSVRPMHTTEDVQYAAPDQQWPAHSWCLLWSWSARLLGAHCPLSDSQPATAHESMPSSSAVHTSRWTLQISWCHNQMPVSCRYQSTISALEARRYLYGPCGSPEGPVHTLTVLRVQKAILVCLLATALCGLLSSLQNRLKTQAKLV